MKRGVSPRRISNHLKEKYDEILHEKKIYAFKKLMCPNVETVRNLEIIDPCDDTSDDYTHEYTVEELANQRTRIGIKLGNRIEQKIDDDEPLDAKETQLYSVCCKAADKDNLVSDVPEIEITDDDVEWINHVSDYNK